MSVTQEDVKDLHEKIDRHKSDVYHEISKPLNELTVEIGKLVTAFSSHEKDKERLESNQRQQGKDINDIKKELSDFKLSTSVAMKGFSVKQNGILATAGKFAVPLFSLASMVSAIMIIIKLD